MKARAAKTAMGVTALVMAAAAFAPVDWERVRHLAVPVLSDPSLPARREVVEVATLPGCATTTVASIPGRVGAVLEAAGTVWIGGFDTESSAWSKGAPIPVPGLAGRERFVNALAEHRGHVFAATYSGVMELAPDGSVAKRHLKGNAVESLLELEEGRLLAGTAKGLFVLAGGRFEDAGAVDSRGAPLRVNALAVSGGTLWMGTPSGAWTMPVSALASGKAAGLRWRPLVFGPHAADTNVVLSLAAVQGGAVAGTDDGGLVLVMEDGTVRAARVSEARANETNPGAVAAVGALSAFGTQGGGLVLARESGGILELSRPEGWGVPRVSALASGSGRLLVGADDGQVLRAECSDRLASR